MPTRSQREEWTGREPDEWHEDRRNLGDLEYDWSDEEVDVLRAALETPEAGAAVSRRTLPYFRLDHVRSSVEGLVERGRLSEQEREVAEGVLDRLPE